MSLELDSWSVATWFDLWHILVCQLLARMGHQLSKLNDIPANVAFNFAMYLLRNQI